MLLADPALCRGRKQGKEPKNGAAESGLTRIAGKVLAEGDRAGTVTVTDPRKGTVGLGQGDKGSGSCVPIMESFLFKPTTSRSTNQPPPQKKSRGLQLPTA